MREEEEERGTIEGGKLLEMWAVWYRQWKISEEEKAEGVCKRARAYKHAQMHTHRGTVAAEKHVTH